jgi:hypothetical protein
LNSSLTNKRHLHLVENRGELICISKSAVPNCHSNFF